MEKEIIITFNLNGCSSEDYTQEEFQAIEQCMTSLGYTLEDAGCGEFYWRKV